MFILPTLQASVVNDFPRLIFGLIIFQLFMWNVGFRRAISCPSYVLHYFGDNVSWNLRSITLPLHNFIALRAIKEPCRFRYAVRWRSTAALAPSEEVLEVWIFPISRTRKPHNGGGNRNLRSTWWRFSISNASPQQEHRRKVSTVDEEQGQFTDYTHPDLVKPSLRTMDWFWRGLYTDGGVSANRW